MATTELQTESRPLTDRAQSKGILIALWLFVAIPFLALVAAIPVAIVLGALSWLDVGLFAVLYCVSGLGITAGYHRYFTHSAFKAKRGLRIALAVAGCMAVQGEVTQWVADHRRHHRYSDQEGDPHSPWAYGASVWGITKGLWHAHWGWLFQRELTNKRRFALDLVRDRDIQRVDKLFPVIIAVSLLLPGLIGGLVTLSWTGALEAFFWAGLVRVSFLHHVTWSINSICHVVGDRPYRTPSDKDKAANFWPLAILSFGESWHNSHHADPTCARHGVDRLQLDSTARLIRVFEKLGWATSVRWPDPKRAKLKHPPV